MNPKSRVDSSDRDTSSKYSESTESILSRRGYADDRHQKVTSSTRYDAPRSRSSHNIHGRPQDYHRSEEVGGAMHHGVAGFPEGLEEQASSRKRNSQHNSKQRWQVQSQNPELEGHDRHDLEIPDPDYANYTVWKELPSTEVSRAEDVHFFRVKKKHTKKKKKKKKPQQKTKTNKQQQQQQQQQQQMHRAV